MTTDKNDRIYEVNFGGSVFYIIRVKDDGISVDGAIDRYGNPLVIDKVIINELTVKEKEEI